MPINTGLDLSSTCVQLSTGPGELCVDIFGAKLCAQVGYDLGDPGTIVKSMLGQINTALVPLSPFFDILDFIKAITDCVQAIPDCLGPPPDPSKLLKCIPQLIKVVNKILQKIPPFPIFIMVKGILTVIITGLQGVKLKIQALLAQVARITRAALRATQTGNEGLHIVLDCANGNMDAQLHNMNLEFAPLNRLIGIINILLELAGQDCIPAIGGIASISADALAPLDAVIKLLQTIQAAIPVGLPPLAPIQPGACP
jgi:hypothetical protein